MKKLIQTILTQPTAPFCESWVQEACMEYCNRVRLPFYQDSYGNLWVNAASQKEARNSSLVFVSHMDHPGMVIQQFKKTRTGVMATAKWLGGGPQNILNHEVLVFAHAHSPFIFDGIVRKHTKTKRGPDEVEIEIQGHKVASLGTDSIPDGMVAHVCTPKALKTVGPWGACLWYRKAGIPEGIAQKGSKYVTKAADDLMGVCALLKALTLSKRPKGVTLLLTRAEECGFNGTIDVLKNKILKSQNTLMLSVETSAQLPGAILGQGPVIRQGDRSTLFDPAFTQWLQQIAYSIQKKHTTFKFQKRVMDGGTCEASAFNWFGFRVAGISMPLENYHNQSKSGKPLPEGIHVNDADRTLQFLTEIMKQHKRSDVKNMQAQAFGRNKQAILKSFEDHTKRYKND